MAKLRKDPKQILPLGKLKILVQRAIEDYGSGNHSDFAAVFDYFGLPHPDVDALEIGRADHTAYNKKLSEVDRQYSGDIGVNGTIRFRPCWLGTNSK